MSDAGNLNGEVLDDPVVNSAVVGVDVVSGDGNEPEPTAATVGVDGFDPGAHTVAEVQAYVDEHPDQIQAVYDAEVAGKARATLVTWLEDAE